MTYHIFELRQYLLHPGQRETLIELFDRELVESGPHSLDGFPLQQPSVGRIAMLASRSLLSARKFLDRPALNASPPS